ncbi:MAG TPA: hypothetical protein DDX91_10175 [Ruminococcaceae bacterium]|nr:hypothetical protein [Oscillospiraceae bacterium]
MFLSVTLLNKNAVIRYRKGKEKMKKSDRISFIAFTAALFMAFTGCSDEGRTDIALTGGSGGTVKTDSQSSSHSPQGQPETGGAQSAEAAHTSSESGFTPTQGEYEPPMVENQQVINGNMVFSYKDHWWGVQLYAGGYNQDLYVRSVDAFAKDLEGIAQVYSMVAPTKADFYCPKGYEEYNASQLEDINYIEQHLSDRVKSVRCYDILQQHIDEYIYFRTDHHWTANGAYYAAAKFAEAAGVPFKEMNSDNFEEKVIEGFVGSLYSSTNDSNLLNDPDAFAYYVPKNKYECYYYDMAYNLDGKYPFFIAQEPRNAFGTYMGSDKKIVRIETDCKNGRRLMVIKDSYGDVEIPFYMNSFEEIYVTDVRFFDLNAIDFIKEQGITDVLFTMCTYSAAGQNCEGIERMRTGAGHLINW